MTPNVDKLLNGLLQARPAMDDNDRALAAAAYRRLALGEPVTGSDLATATGQDVHHVHDRLGAWPGVYRDGQQNVIGFWGLTVADMPPHRYRTRRANLSVWCAFDPLFITPILGETAEVKSVDADTGEPLTLTVTADGTISSSNPDLVMSFLDPTGRFDGDIIQSFCHYVHYFTTREHGEHWIARHPGTYLLESAEAAELGRHYADHLGAPR